MTMQTVKSAKSYIPPTGYSGHSLKDARSLALHCVIAWKISKDPSLLEKAKEYQAARRKTHAPGRVPLYEEEWERILTLPWLQVAAFLIAVTEDAIRFRTAL